MFFSISKHFDNMFPNNIQYGDFHIGYDNGWNHVGNIMYKGTTDTGLLNISSEKDIDSYRNIDGTFCIISFIDTTIEIIFGCCRRFPIFRNRDSVSNLYKYNRGYELEIYNNEVLYNPPNQYSYKHLDMNDDQLFDLLDTKISNYITNFKSDNLIKVYPTGGVDSILILAYLLKHNIPYEIVPGEYIEMDYFLCKHRQYLRKEFWAYQTIQHWKSDSALYTGAHGDEMMLRNPLSAYLLMKFHGEDLVSICKKDLMLYHSLHCLEKESLQKYNNHSRQLFLDEDDIKDYIMNIHAEDYQHWHLGNTLYITPFNNMDLLNISLNFSYEVSRKQMLDAYISKELIRRNRPGLLKLVSNIKNINYYENMAEVFDGTVRLEDL